MILFIGQVGGDFIDREAFQEVDYRRMYGQMAKWVAQIDRAERIPEYLARAFQVATSGRQGPVVLALPEDMLVTQAAVPDLRRYQPVQASPAQAQIDALRTMLAGAQRPLLLLGGSGWTEQACADIARFTEANHLPVACAFRYQDLLDNDHPHYVGDVGIGINPKLAARVKEADVLIALGPRLGEMTTGGYTVIEAPLPRQRLVHIHASMEELGSVYQAELMIASGMPQAAAMLAAMAPVDTPAWVGSVADAREELRAWQERPAIFQDGQAPLDLWQVVRDIDTLAPRDVIITNGAGNYATWAHRFHRYGGMRTQLAPTSGAMGYSVPAGVAARIIDPQRTVITFAGDGEFMMNGQELATAVQHGVGVIVIVFNNRMFGTIRMHQEREYPGRISATVLKNPDFAAYATAFGGHGERVETTEDFAPALARAFASRKPAILHCLVDPEAITPSTTLTAIRDKARAAQSIPAGEG
jgi:acetolactate synthase-1/2/3 large subunit